MTKHHVADENAQHEYGLREIFEPLSVAYEIPLGNNSFTEDGVVIFVASTVRLANVVEFLCCVPIGACEVHRRGQEYDTHLMPCHGKFDKENNEADPYLPFAYRTDRFCERVNGGLVFDVLCFILQHCNYYKFGMFIYIRYIETIITFNL